jgi:Membrane bound beta barrel domain (DUF5777)
METEVGYPMIWKPVFVASFQLALFVSQLSSQASPPPDGDGGALASLPPQSPKPGSASVDLIALGIEFVEGSTTTLLVEREGKHYLVNLVSRTVQEVALGKQAQAGESSSAERPPQVSSPNAPNEPHKKRVYEAGDDQLFTLPTGRRLNRHGLYINFTHRFPFESAFEGRARGAILLGLDDVAISSFGFRFGITNRLSVLAYRAPSFIGRTIELMAAYMLSSESDGAPLNTTVRFSVDGQDNFSRNFTSNFELILSRSVRRRAQLYFVPTLSLHNRPVIGSLAASENPPPLQPCSQLQANGLFGPFSSVRPCADTFALGVGAAVDIRPTVALLAEAQPVLVNGPELGIHRSAFAFGIQKKIWRHAFTFGFTNSPGTTVSQRIGTRATYLGQPNTDTPARVFVGFDLTRQLR